MTSPEQDLSGCTLTHYQVVEKIGAGGMGVVYRAFDTILERNVAIKVLSPEKVSDLSRGKRFIQEAKAASALNHPSIVTIYEIGVVGEAQFIAMEYVAGRTLDNLIGAKGLPVTQVLDYGVQIADALAAAHAARIVHRDVKPANIMVTSHGLVKILDFGLSKLVDFSQAGDETVSLNNRPMTVAGTIVGTLAYLSPEQAAAGRVDARSDIFAVGAVLYEMVTGRRAFAGDNAISTLMAIAGKEPEPIGEIEGDGAGLEQIIARCLRKEPERRFQSMDEVKTALDGLRQQSMIRRTTGLFPVRRPRDLRMVGAGAILACLLAGGALWWRTRAKPENSWRPVVTRLTAGRGMSAYPALSADGKLLAYASDRGGNGSLDIWVQQVSGGDAIRVTNDPADEYEPAFSPDGSEIVYRSDRGAGGIYLAPALGGPSRRIAPRGRRPLFSPDGKQILYWLGIIGGRVFLVDLEGGRPRAFQPEFDSARNPVWSPDGKEILFLGNRDSKGLDSTGQTGESLDWWIAPVAGGPAVRTGALEAFRRAGIAAPPNERQIEPDAWTSAGQVIFSARLGGTTNLWRIALSPQSRKVTGIPQRLTLGTNLEVQAGATALPNGLLRMVFASLTRAVDLWGLPLDANRAKVTGEFQRLTEDPAATRSPAVSPDGKKLAFISSRTGNDEIWLKNLVTDKETAITSTTSEQYKSSPSFSPDGSEVAYESVVRPNVPGVFAVSMGPEGLPSPPRKLCEQCGASLAWSSDSRKLLFELFPPARAFILDVASGSRVEILHHPEGHVWQVTFSPDDRWVTFNVTTSEIHSRVYIAPVPKQPGLIPVNEWIAITDGEGWDDKPRWSPDGDTLYFVSERDGYRCIWYQRLNPVYKLPKGAPSPLYHLHGSRLSMSNVDLAFLGIGLARDKIIFNLAELTGNIWMAQAQSQP